MTYYEELKAKVKPELQELPLPLMADTVNQLLMDAGELAYRINNGKVKLTNFIDYLYDYIDDSSIKELLERAEASGFQDITKCNDYDSLWNYFDTTTHAQDSDFNTLASDYIKHQAYWNTISGYVLLTNI